MATLSDGTVVHASRIEIGGDLHDQLDKNGLKVVNRWVKKEATKKERLR
jgi:hypothetical protein